MVEILRTFSPVLSAPDIELFNNLSDSEKQAVQRLLVRRRIPKGESLFQQGNLCTDVFFVLSGKIKLSRLTSEGREQILQILGPGDSCACHPGLDGWCCSASAQALCDSWVLSMRREDYRYLIHANSKMALVLSKIFAKRLQAFSALVDDVSLKEVPQRLARLLLALAQDHGIPVRRGTLIPTDFTREELASRIGAARETVVRILYDLKRKKLIDLKSRRQITLLDEAALRKLL